MRGSPLPLGPRALSDGTLRFLALVTLFLDPQSCAVLCMEEPENGIHPARIPAMVSLLRDFALDPKHETSEENPARQVIINTHSPDVVRQLDAADLLFVDALDAPGGPSARVSAIEGRWRARRPPFYPATGRLHRWRAARRDRGGLQGSSGQRDDDTRVPALVADGPSTPSSATHRHSGTSGRPRPFVFEPRGLIAVADAVDQVDAIIALTRVRTLNAGDLTGAAAQGDPVRAGPCP